MKKVIAHGAAKANGLLPAYTVPLQILEEDDFIKDTDLMLFGSNEQNYHNWTIIARNSPFCGLTVKAVNLQFHATFARKILY